MKLKNLYINYIWRNLFKYCDMQSANRNSNFHHLLHVCLVFALLYDANLYSLIITLYKFN